ILTPRSIPARYRGGEAAAPGGPGEGAPPAREPRRALTVELGDGAGRPFAFHRLESVLFIAAVKALGRDRGRLSVRQLAAELAVSKSSVSRRLWTALERGVVTSGELDGIVRVAARPRRNPSPD